MLYMSALFQIQEGYITGKDRHHNRVRAKDLLYYWSVTELGISMVDLARRFDITAAAVSCTVQRGEKLALKKDYRLEI